MDPRLSVDLASKALLAHHVRSSEPSSTNFSHPKRNTVSLRIYDEPRETVESPEQVNAPIASRILFALWATVIVVMSALTALYSALQVTNLFRNMRNAEDARAATVFAQLHSSNTPLILGLGASALLAFVLALLLATDDKRRVASVGLPFSIGVPIFAAAPALLLWWAESITIDLLNGRLVRASVAETAGTVSLLIFCAMLAGLVVQAAALVCAIVSLCIPTRSRSEALSIRRAFVWAITGTLLLAFAGALFLLV